MKNKLKKLNKDTGMSQKASNIKRTNSQNPIMNVTYIFLGLFVLIIGYFSYFLVVRSSEVINSTYNKRHDVLTERVIRGNIYGAAGEVLAQTLVDEDGKETRDYPYDDMFVHVIGRYDRGRTGLEETENIRLLTSDINSIDNMMNELQGIKNPGNNIYTTLNVKLQQVAYDALGDQRGAVVVMEPSTGKILALVSKPDYNPNKINEQWNELVKNEEGESPLLNRATSGLYPPGSTFKVMTALEYMREHNDYLDYEYDCDGRITYDKMTIHCYKNKAHGDIDLKTSFAKSCNSSFAFIGTELNLNTFFQLCEEFVFNKSLPSSIGASQSSYTLQKVGSSVKDAMQTAIGQGKTLITPLHNAMIAATVANKGIMMKPYVVDRIVSADDHVVRNYHPVEYKRLMTTVEANTLTTMMEEVVLDGTATELKDLEVSAAGKTGTAENAGEKAHAWFIGFAPVEDPQLVVSIIVENAGTSSDYAVPIARDIFEAYFNGK
ncbi:MAG: hypothetical protein K0S47_1886 [Herbinix sp.]|jgi:peptidoglycan glycosyltransferase|nr:hypothetical protein [Herbinix sp.]